MDDFPVSFRGFDKDYVNKFIEEQAKELIKYKQTVEKLQNKITQLSNQIKSGDADIGNYSQLSLKVAHLL
jgi:cell division septum initiation protein DivIVA